MVVEIKSVERDHTFDNIKALLIILVVVGHMLSGYTGGNIIAKTLYYFIYLFHMPVFIFITGYFSKNVDKSREHAFRNFLIPYLVFNSLYTILGHFSLFNRYTSFRLFSPVWGMWFLLAVFIWRILLKDLIKIRFILPLSFVIGILSGFSEEFASYLTLSRALTYLPFFLLGFYAKKEHIQKMKDFPKWMAYMMLFLFGVIAYLISEFKLFNAETLYFRKAYSFAKQEVSVSVMGRIFIYFASIIILICLFNIFENRYTWYTKIGKNSLTVYIIHLFVVNNLKRIDISFAKSNWYALYAIVISFIIAFILSRDVIKYLYEWCMNVVYHSIFKKNRGK